MTSTISTHAPTRPPRRPSTPVVRRLPCRPTERQAPPGSTRVLHPTVISSLDEYRAAGGLAGLQAASERHSSEIIDIVLDSGLRGRGGAGFPTGRKWQTVAANALSTSPSTVVVNGAEGEPGTFKDRSILRRNPYQVIEGAYVAARAVHADRVVIALKRSFAGEVARTRAALDEMRAAKVLPDTIPCSVFEGPDEYLYGEETALLETLDGRGPFPRVVPPFRVGLRGHDPWRPVGDGPALVNNVETIANVPQIMACGPRWFDAVGTSGSAGTVVCTVSGQLQRDDVGEVPMGTSLRHVLDRLGGGPVPGAPVKAVLSGVANPVIVGDQLDVPVSHEGMRSIGLGLGSAGFIVFAEPTDMVAVAAGVARFLSIESCGQCTPCKTDGATLYELLARLAASNASAADLDEIEHRINTVSFGARCNLGIQQETVLSSILERFHDEFEAHLRRAVPGVAPVYIAELADVGDGVAAVDAHHLDKQPDWTYGRRSSGATPADLRRRYRVA
jgi:NADH-quinone oxidoreductase subunit F